MKLKYQILVFVTLFTKLIISQDFHFSQFNENPSLINPALTGATHVIRVSITYKDQWKAITVPYTSYGFSFESKFKASNWEKADPNRTMIFKKSTNRIAGGLSVYNDKAGDGRMGTLQSNLSLAMFFPLNKFSSLSFGLQGNFTQLKIDNSKFIYPSQYNGTAYDPNLANGEIYSQQSFTYPSFAAGALWSYGQNEKSIAANNQVKALIGFSTYHINQPIQKFVSGPNDKLYRKYIFHGNLLFGLPNTMFAIAPSWLLQVQGTSSEIAAGTMVKYYMKDDSKYTGIIKRTSVGIGVSYRVKDAIITNLLIETGKYAIGLSYDINASGLSQASKGRGGFEIMIRYVTPAAYLYQRRAKAMY